MLRRTFLLGPLALSAAAFAQAPARPTADAIDAFATAEMRGIATRALPAAASIAAAR